MHPTVLFRRIAGRLRRLTRRPRPVGAPGAPAPFIVGVPRSGTTLLRLMLDAHPQLAIPPETGFLPEAAAARDRRSFVRLLTEAPVRNYLEVRYEDLIADAPSVLRQICARIELPYQPAMERYHERAGARLEEHEARHDGAGRLLISKEQRLHNQRFARLPPQASRVHRWRHEMTVAERARFARSAGRLLARLGYEP